MEANVSDDTLKTVSSIIALVLGIMGFAWSVIKDREKIPPQFRRILNTIFRQGTAWLLLIILAGLIGYLSYTEQNPRIYTIEKAPVMTSILYEGARNPSVNQGSGYLSVTSDTRAGVPYTSFTLDYNLPADGDAYSGAAILFPEPLDLTDYNSVEFTVSFSDGQARCRFFIKDAFDGQDSVILGDGNIMSATMQPQTVQLPLDTYFPSVARKAIREINLDVNNFFTEGNHSFKVSQIRFLK
jgi:hypothetical protein